MLVLQYASGLWLHLIQHFLSHIYLTFLYTDSAQDDHESTQYTAQSHIRNQSTHFNELQKNIHSGFRLGFSRNMLEQQKLT